MIRPIAYLGEPCLRKKGEPITEFGDELKKLYEDMLETMYETNGMGIAAPQVFKSLAFFITAPPYQKEDGSWELSPPRPFANPKILAYSEEMWVHDEACLSIPKISGAVQRPIWVEIEYQDLEGKKHQERLEEWPARVFLHENDHINGVLFIDRMDKNDRKKIDDHLKRIRKTFGPKK